MKRAMAAVLLVLLTLLVHSNAEEEAFDVRHHLSTVSRFLSHKIKISHSFDYEFITFLFIFKCVLVNRYVVTRFLVLIA